MILTSYLQNADSVDVDMDSVDATDSADLEDAADLMGSADSTDSLGYL